MIELFFKLLFGHALADFGLQSDFIARHKDYHNDALWPMFMAGHALIHGGVVYFITGSLFCGIVETINHFGLDLAKCKGFMGPYQDQAMHMMIKISYLGTAL